MIYTTYALTPDYAVEIVEGTTQEHSYEFAENIVNTLFPELKNKLYGYVTLVKGKDTLNAKIITIDEYKG